MPQQSNKDRGCTFVGLRSFINAHQELDCEDRLELVSSVTALKTRVEDL